MRPPGRVLNLDPKRNQSIHLLRQGIGFLQHLFHFALVELVHLIELIIQPPKVHQLVLSSFVGGHQERRLVTLRPSSFSPSHLIIHSIHQNGLALDVFVVVLVLVGRFRHTVVVGVVLLC
ncbi:unnamed protein product [Linum tenue]|uniref:Uncharacterized protein n=1 Tax=Linum tenue TaxID=586396 RepID=A0AAV0I4B2_9ROSI|nr:unnamed protein product [Linum tenue]